MTLIALQGRRTQFAAQDAFGQVFVLDPKSPLGIRFVTDRFYIRLLFTASRYWFNEFERGAVFRAAVAEFDEHTALVRRLEIARGETEYWKLIVDQNPPDMAILQSENCTYSENGNWGAFFSQVGVALLGGSRHFIEGTEAMLPRSFREEEEGAREYLEELAKSSRGDTAWIGELFAQINAVDE